MSEIKLNGSTFYQKVQKMVQTWNQVILNLRLGKVHCHINGDDDPSDAVDHLLTVINFPSIF